MIQWVGIIFGFVLSALTITTTVAVAGNDRTPVIQVEVAK